MAEHEMLGLMNCQTEYSPSQPFKELNINGPLHETIQAGVLMETLAALGAAEQMMTVLGADGCDMLVDDGGDATLLMYKGKVFEEKYAKDGSLPDPASADNAEIKCILQLLKILSRRTDQVHADG